MLLQEVEVYKEHVLAQQVMEQILNFVDEKGNTVLQLGAIVKVIKKKISCKFKAHFRYLKKC